MQLIGISDYGEFSMRKRIRQSTVREPYVLAAAFAACIFSLTTASAQQESPSAFVIVQRTATTGSESIQAEYAKLAREILPKYGARYLARSQRNVLLEGNDPAPCCIAILQFPSMDAVRRWYDSPENQAAAKIRQSGAKFEIIAVDGLPPSQ
jgi:uncharacterized protein (DUF1330 family)